MVGRVARRAWTSDQHALCIYELADADPHAPPGPLGLLRQLGGDLAIHRANEFPAWDARVIEYHDSTWDVEIHPNLPLPMARAAMALGIARWYGGAIAQMAIDVQDLGAAIQLPGPAILLAANDGRVRAEDLAAEFGVSVATAIDRLVKCGIQPVRRGSGAYPRA